MSDQRTATITRTHTCERTAYSVNTDKKWGYDWAAADTIDGRGHVTCGECGNGSESHDY